MKKLSLFLILSLAISQVVWSQNIGINATGAAPAASAMLDVSAANKGLLIPRVALTATNAAGPVAAPATSLLVYNTATAGASPNNVVPGYYYWNGAAWVSLLSSSSIIPGVWSSTGNSGTTAGTNFIGTTDAKDFVIKTNNVEKVRVMSAGNVGIGTAAPTAKLDVSGTYKLGTAGTVLNSMIKTSVNINDATTFTQTTTRQITITVNGATVNGTVVVNPRTALANGIGIGWARVSAANTVIIGFTNANGTARSVGNVTFDITIIQ